MSAMVEQELIMYRKILVPIAGAKDDQASVQSAFELAKRFGARAEVLFVRPNPGTAIPFGYLGDDAGGYAARYAVEAAIKAADQAQSRARSTFDKMVDKHHVREQEKVDAKTEPTACFAVVEGVFAEEIERRARLSDLVVFGAKTKSALETETCAGFESALLAGVRPILFAPAGAGATIGQRIAIAYDGSATAAHAVTAALPFLAEAKELHAFEVTSEKSTALSDLQDYLSLRGLTLVVHSLDPGLKNTAEALFAAAQDHKCDMIVLGGYGHSRLGEFIFGGVTRHVFKNRMSLAVLMAH